MCEMNIASIFTKDRCYCRIRCCVPSPQSMRNKRPCTDSAWALGFLSEKGRAEAEPNIVSVKFISDYSPFSSFSLRAARASMSPRVVFSTDLLMFFTALLVVAASLAAAFSFTS